MGYFIKVNGAAVIWDSRLQSVIAQSTTEAEYIVMAEVCKSIMFCSMLFKELGIKFDMPIHIRCDNQSAITISNNGSTNRQTRHIAVRYHLIRRCVQLGLVRPEFVPGTDEAPVCIKDHRLSYEYDDFSSLQGREIVCACMTRRGVLTELSIPLPMLINLWMRIQESPP